MIKKLIGTEEERAVSPVIGVILMVAITVILAAVIAAFVLDLGGSLNQEAQAGVTIEETDTAGDYRVTWVSQGNSEEIDIRGSCGSGSLNNPGQSEVISCSTDETINAVAITEDGVETTVSTHTHS